MMSKLKRELMQESNKLVVKVKYKGLNQGRDEPVMITEWHAKRIVTAITLLIVFILLPFYLFDDESINVPSDTTLKSHVKPVEKVLEKEPQEIIKPVAKAIELDIDKKSPIVLAKSPENTKEDISIETEVESIKVPITDVVRALLTTSIINKEPVDNMVFPLILNKDKAKNVYYFTEIINRKGQYLFHQWFRNDKLIYKRKISILGNRWRAATSKLIPYSKTGMWTVRLVDKKGFILNEIKFEVIN